jgi:hypothetical protein
VKLENVMSKRDRHFLVYFVVWVGNKDYVMKMPFLLVWGECRVIQVVSWLLGPSLLLHCWSVTYTQQSWQVFFPFWPGGLTRCYSSSVSCLECTDDWSLALAPPTSLLVDLSLPLHTHEAIDIPSLHSLFSFRALHLQTQRIGYSSWKKTRNKSIQ